jgi:hypothetical protein
VHQRNRRQPAQPGSLSGNEYSFLVLPSSLAGLRGTRSTAVLETGWQCPHLRRSEARPDRAGHHGLRWRAWPTPRTRSPPRLQRTFPSSCSRGRRKGCRLALTLVSLQSSIHQCLRTCCKVLIFSLSWSGQASQDAGGPTHEVRLEAPQGGPGRVMCDGGFLRCSSSCAPPGLGSVRGGRRSLTRSP